MKKVYFTCAIAGGRDYAFVYKDMVKAIKDNDAQVLGEVFADPNLEAEIGTDPELSSQNIWERDTNWLQEADALIAEGTQPSLGVGYQIARAENLKKPVLVLFYRNSRKRFSSMISGNPLIETCEYTEHAKAKKAIKTFIEKLG